MSLCSATTGNNFPHHWQCMYSTGHIKTDCTDNCDGRCSSFECSLADGTKRCPDGSIAARAHLESGGHAVGIRNLADNTIEVIQIPKNL